jgi:catechol 2,3-dioxygenase-like lactoylglutathione lyase family enzyme
MKQRVSVITLDVSDLERARAFYEALGWSTGADPGLGPAAARRGQLRRRLARLGWRDPGAEPRLAGRGRRRDREARAAGATIGHEPTETFWGGYSGVQLN